MVADDGGLTVGGVGIGEAVGGLIVVADGGDTVEIVVGILNLAAVAMEIFRMMISPPNFSLIYS